MSAIDSEDENESYIESTIQSEITLSEGLRRDMVEMNKVQELIEDNKGLREKLRMTASDLNKKTVELTAFYRKMKSSAQNLWKTLTSTKAKMSEQEREMAMLKAENLRLKIDATATATENLAINSTGLNGTAGNDFMTEYRETLASLEQQLKESEQEKKRSEENFELRMQELEKAWQKREIEIQGALQDQARQFTLHYNGISIEMQRQHQAILLEQQQHSERKEAELKAQVTALINEHQSDKKLLEKCQADKATAMIRAQELEAAKFKASTEIEKSKNEKKTLEDELVRVKQDLEQVTYQRNEKEKSLDQLFEVYNKEREELQRLEAATSNTQGDKIYAQYLCAEESIKKKNEEIATMQKKLETLELESGTQISIYREQANIFKKDFEMEREARQKQHSECENLKTMVAQYQIEMQRMKQDIMRLQAQHFPRPYAP